MRVHAAFQKQSAELAHCNCWSVKVLTTKDFRSDNAASKRCRVSGTIMADSASTVSCKQHQMHMPNLVKQDILQHAPYPKGLQGTIAGDSRSAGCMQL
jgi:hypothetical protein